jgi:hypothetical protein
MVWSGGIMAWWKQRKVKCGDRVLFVYRKASDAFPVTAPKSHYAAEATGAVIKELELKIKGEFSNEVSELGARVDRINLSMREKHLSAYLVFQADPCSNSALFAERMREIANEEQELRGIALVMESGIRMLEAGAPGRAVLDFVHQRLEVQEIRKRPNILPESALVKRLEEWEA